MNNIRISLANPRKNVDLKMKCSFNDSIKMYKIREEIKFLNFWCVFAIYVNNCEIKQQHNEYWRRGEEKRIEWWREDDML